MRFPHSRTSCNGIVPYSTVWFVLLIAWCFWDPSLSLRDLLIHSFFFFLLLNSIQLYEYNDCLFTTDRHLGCFWGLGIMNKAAMNIPLQGLCGQMLSFLLGKYPVMELLGHGEKNPYVPISVFSKSFYTLYKSVWEFHLLTNIWLCQSF